MGDAHELLPEMRSAAFDQYPVLPWLRARLRRRGAGGAELTAEPDVGSPRVDADAEASPRTVTMGPTGPARSALAGSVLAGQALAAVALGPVGRPALAVDCGRGRCPARGRGRRVRARQLDRKPAVGAAAGPCAYRGVECPGAGDPTCGHAASEPAGIHVPLAFPVPVRPPPRSRRAWSASPPALSRPRRRWRSCSAITSRGSTIITTRNTRAPRPPRARQTSPRRPSTPGTRRRPIRA